MLLLRALRMERAPSAPAAALVWVAHAAAQALLLWALRAPLLCGGARTHAEEAQRREAGEVLYCRLNFYFIVTFFPFLVMIHALIFDMLD